MPCILRCFAVALLTVVLASTGVAAPTSKTFESNGVTLHYLVEGTGDTVVLLHGFSGSAQGLYVAPGTFGHLVDGGYRVIALDQRGHGESEKPYDPDSYGEQMIDDIDRLLRHLDVDQVHLVGYSMGSKVANRFREKYPHALRSLVLGGYGWPWQSTRPESLQAARDALGRRTLLPGNDLDALAAVSLGMADLTSSEPALRENTIPTLAIIGDKDEVVSVQDRDTLADTMANLELIVMPGTHAGPDGAPYKPRYGKELLAFINAQSNSRL